MTKVYLTFGQVHTHSVNGKTFDKDCIAVIKCIDYNEGRKLAFEYFDGIFHNCYSAEEWKDQGDEIIQYFPRGLMEVN